AMSPACANARTPSVSSSSTTARASASRDWYVIMTSAPARASSSAVARPTPREPPVTSARLPGRSIPSISSAHPLPAQPAALAALDADELLQHRARLSVHFVREQRLVARNHGALSRARDVLPPVKPRGRGRARRQVLEVLPHLHEPGAEARQVMLLIGVQAVQPLGERCVTGILREGRQRAVEECLQLLGGACVVHNRDDAHDCTSARSRPSTASQMA